MAQLKHYRNIDNDFRKGARQAQKMGGPSDALQKLKKRPGGTYNIRGTRADGYCYMNGRGLVICKKCGEKKLDGYLKEQLCEECYVQS